MSGLATLRARIFQLPRDLIRLGTEKPNSTMWFWIVLSLLLAATLPSLKLDTSTSTFLNQTDPAWQVYQKSLEHFGGDEFIVVALEADVPFDRETLDAVRRLTRQLEALPGVRRVDSLATVPLVRAGPEGELLISAPLKDGVPKEAPAFHRLLEDLRRDRVAPGSLFSKNERIFAINVMLDEHVRGDRTRIVAEIRDLLRGRSALASGVPLFRTAVNSRTYKEILIFVPITLLCVAMVVAIAFGSLRPVSVPLAVGTVGTLMTLGAMSLTGVSLSLSSMALPSILLAL